MARTKRIIRYPYKLSGNVLLVENLTALFKKVILDGPHFLFADSDIYRMHTLSNEDASKSCQAAKGCNHAAEN